MEYANPIISKTNCNEWRGKGVLEFHSYYSSEVNFREENRRMMFTTLSWEKNN